MFLWLVFVGVEKKEIGGSKEMLGNFKLIPPSSLIEMFT